VIASAPGKLILAGEYAVLAGHPALVMAVNRRAVAARAADPEPLSPYLARIVALLDRDPGDLRVDTSGFRHRSGAKLGLGSSAAATVAFAAALAPELDRPALHALTHRAHGEVQAAAGARGSGVDVAASVWGGVIRAVPRGGDPVEVEAVALPAELSWVGVWTGRPADTRDLVARVMASPDPGALAAIAAAAEALGRARSAGAAVAAIAAAGEAVAALGARAGIELVTPAHRRIAALAVRAGGAAKPTGAGGGDTAVAAFADVAAARRFGDLAASEGWSVLDVAVDPRGAEVHNP
jgi:phosphomevalonate kinase